MNANPLPLRTKLEELLRPLIEDLGYELVDLRLLSGRGRLTLQLMADREGGITLDECARLSREIAPHLEVADLIHSAYDLEVSSPGIRRPLPRPADFDRFRGQPAVVKTRRAIEGRKRFRGIILEAEEPGRVVLDAEEGAGRVSIPWEDVEEARLDPEIRFK